MKCLGRGGLRMGINKEVVNNASLILLTLGGVCEVLSAFLNKMAFAVFLSAFGFFSVLISIGILLSLNWKSIFDFLKESGNKE